MRLEHQIILLTEILAADGPVRREHLRSKLPNGRVKDYGLTQFAKRTSKGDTGGRNALSLRMQDLLRDWVRLGWIRRTETHVEALDRAALKCRLAELETQIHPKKSLADLEREIASRRA